MYINLYFKANTRGTDRLGQTRASGARSGLVGSDFGDAQKEKTVAYNAEEVANIEKQKALEIGTVLDKFDQRAEEKIKAENEKWKTNTESWLGFLKTQSESAKTDAVNYFKTGGSLDTLSDEQYKKILDQTGWSPEQAKTFSIINKPEDKVLTSFTQGNKYYVVSQDPVTKKRKTETVDLGFTVPTDYGQTKLNDGTIIFYPEKFDPSKPIKDQIMTYVVPGFEDLDSKEKKLRIQKLQQELEQGESDPDVVNELKEAQKALDQNADHDAVRRRFLEKYPNKGDLYLKYTKQAY